MTESFSDLILIICYLCSITLPYIYIYVCVCVCVCVYVYILFPEFSHSHFMPLFNIIIKL